MASQETKTSSVDEPREKTLACVPSSEAKNMNTETAPASGDIVLAHRSNPERPANVEPSTSLAEEKEAAFERFAAVMKMEGAEGGSHDSETKPALSVEQDVDREKIDYLHVQHPTGTIRECPSCPLETEPPRNPLAVQIIQPSDSPVKHPTASPSITPSSSPEKSVNKNFDRRCHYCSRLLTSESALCCHPPEQEVPCSRRLYHQTSTTYPVYGAEISGFIGCERPCSSQAPLVVVKCTAEIERWCMDNMDKALSAYEFPGRKEEIKRIRADFNNYLHVQVSLSTYNVHAISGALIRYLRELPNPVIPVQMYDAFIDSRSHSSSAQQEGGASSRTSATDLVEELPLAHRSTLEYLFSHFARLIKWQSKCSEEVDVAGLFRAFSHVLLRPPWDRISEIVDRTKLHMDILYDLLLNGKWRDLLPPIKIHPAITCPANPLSTSERFSVQTPEERLKDIGWYWGNITREDTRPLLIHRPVGSFMVRDSSTPGEYTLTIKLESGLKMLKIFHEGDLYGFVHPLEFPSIACLIHWYQSNSLKSYNSKLDTRLLYPVNRNIAPEIPSDDIDKEEVTLVLIDHRHLMKRAQYNFLFQWHSWLRYDANMKENALMSIKDMLDIVKEQLEMTSLVRYAGHEHPKIQDLKFRNRLLHRNENELELDLNRQFVKARLLVGEIESLRLEIRHVERQRAKWISWLLEHGRTQEFVDHLLENENMEGATEKIDLRAAIQDDSLWLVTCNRSDAEALLGSKPGGTFLIRPKPDNNYVLSIIHQGIVHHCKILHSDTGYGFSEQTSTFPNLKTLVIYHHIVSLACHNEQLDTCMKYPFKTMLRRIRQ